ncbi:MAG: hypothetical protein ACN4GZ_02910 [Acidimicrobiales bacterium]
MLNVFLASIAVNAVLGIWALLIDDFGQTQGKVLATSFLVSAMMLSILVNGSPLEKRLLWPLPVLAGVSAAFGFVIFIVMVWTEMDEATPLKLAISALVVGAGGTLAGLLQLFSLRAAHEPLRRANLAVVMMLVLATLSAIWFELDAEWFVRFIGVLSVLAAAMTLAIPALAKFLPPEPTPVAGGAGVRFCPCCGEPLEANRGELDAQGTCGRCGVRFVVSVEVPTQEPTVAAMTN